jgi:hypothetical protein
MILMRKTYAPVQDPHQSNREKSQSVIPVSQILFSCCIVFTNIIGNVLWPGEGYYSFSFVTHDQIEQLPPLFLDGIKRCNLWKKEIEAGGLAVTNCLSLHLPQTSNKDVFCVIRLSYIEGWNFFRLLGLGTPIGRDM